MENICCIKGCEKEVEAMGMCVNHYRMTRLHGSPVAERPLSARMRGLTLDERFLHCVDKNGSDGCWNWIASKDKDGYGRCHITIGMTTYRDAHRASWAFHTGEILNRSIQVLHLCDNPSCVNPEHLQAGSAHENSLDMVSKGRQSKGEQHARRQAKLTEEQARKIAADPRKYEVIAEEYGCQKQCVFDIKNRKTWWFLEDLVIVKNKRGATGENRSQTLTESDVREIRASTETGAALARKYKLSQQTVCDIRKMRSWKHVQ